MKDINKTLFIMNARTESVRVPEKIIRPFAGSSLFEVAIKNLLKSNFLKKNFYVSIRDERLIKIANKYDVNIWHRSKNSCKEPLTIQEIFEWSTELGKKYKWYVNFNACQSCVSTETINKFIDHFINSPFNGLLAVIGEKNIIWGEDGRMLNKFFGDKKYLATLETKLVEKYFKPANCLYAGKMNDIKNGIYMGSFTKKDDPELFHFPPEENFDIDEMWQFELAEQFFKMKYGAENDKV